MQWSNRVFWVKYRYQFVVKLKAIEYKMVVVYYLPSYLSDLGIAPSHQA